jgi:hypothetical protein
MVRGYSALLSEDEEEGGSPRDERVSFGSMGSVIEE